MSQLGQQLSSGALSGLATTVCLQPFDLLKTRLQQGNGALTVKKSSLLLATTRQILTDQGVRGLWRGTVPSLARNVPGVALYMTSLTQLRAFMASSTYFRTRPSQSDLNSRSSALPKLSAHGNLISGATARVAVGFLLNPFSVLKARFESNMYQYASFPSAVVSLAKQGPSELFRGFAASSLRDAPYAGLFVLFYEGVKHQTADVLNYTQNKDIHIPIAPSTFIHGFAAAVAGAVATIATHPFDVIKTKIQVRPESTYRSLPLTVLAIWTHRGIGGFFDGASLRLARKVLSSMVGWGVYEAGVRFVKG